MTLRLTMLRACALLLLAGALSACGFHPRGSTGQYTMPFRTLYLSFPETSSLGTELKRNLRASGETTIVPEATAADAQFDVIGETRGKTIQSLNSLGRVREYSLTYVLVFQVRDAKGNVLLAPTEIALKRSISFNENQVLAKESEEVLLYRDMQSDLVQQILRRLAAIKPL